MMTPEYFAFEQDYATLPDEWLLERIRYWRDTELAGTDWTQLPDAPVDKEAWATYRQALRDLPTSAGNPREIVFPSKP